MKITIVTGFFLPVPPVRGGSTEKIWHRLAREFVAAGHEVTFVSRTWPGFANDEVVDGIRHIRVGGATHSRSLVLNLAHDLRWGMRVARVLPPADIVVCNTPTLPAWLGRVQRRAGRVVAVVARMPKGQARFYGRVDLLLALSDAAAEALRRGNPQLAGRIAPFPYPIDWQLHANAVAKAQPPAPVTIGYVGRIHPEKGVRLLLGAAAKLSRRTNLPAWRLALVGPWSIPYGGAGDAFRDSLSAEFGSTLGSRLQWVGPEFDATALARRYGAMDIFCYPSVAEKGETFGLAIAEAMAARAAPIVSALACFRELVRDGETGVVFDHLAREPEDGLAVALERLIANPAERASLADKGQAHVRQYDFPVVARQVLDQFARVVHGRVTTATRDDPFQHSSGKPARPPDGSAPHDG